MELSLPVGRVTESSPGTATTEAGLTIVVFLRDGAYYALANACPHRGAPLAAGLVDGDYVICPLQHFKFEMKTGQCRLPRNLRARTFAVARDGDRLAITVPDDDPAAPA